MARKLHIQIKPEWDAIRTAWDPCHRHFLEEGLSPDDAYGLSMVAQELLENAVKYGHFVDAAPQVELAVEVGPQEVTLEVKHPVGADSDELREFDRTIQWIRGFQDPFEAYVELLKLASARTWGAERGGLGLARIAYEGRCVLDFYVDDASLLAVSAVWRR